MPVTGSYVEVAGPRWSVRMARKAVPRPWWEVVDAGRPTPAHRELRRVPGGRRWARHEESRMAGDTHPRATWSTTSMLPSSHRGHRRIERPVSAS